MFKKLAVLTLLMALLQISYSQPSVAAAGDTDSALTFNGTSNYLYKTDDAFAFRNAFTIQGWVRPTNVTCSVAACTIFSHDADYIFSIANGTFQLWQYFNGNQITSQLDTGIQAKINEWQHVAYTYSSGAQKFYLDGQLVWQNAISGWSSGPTSYSNYPFKLGYHYGSSLFTGQMDEVRLYSSTRTESEIATDLNRWGPANASGLIAYYDMNDVSGTSVANKVSGATSATTLAMNGSLAQYAMESTSTTSGYTTVTFERSYLNSAGGYKTSTGVTTLQVLVVGGGGGGGFDGGGGGGGGGVYQNSTYTVTENSYYDIDIGVGGKAATGYAGGSGYCNGSWNGTVIGCSGGAGTNSKFGTLTASGGGGGGGIESNGSADSDATANARGGGGGAGGQNSRAGVATGGAGAFSGGGTTDLSGYGGGGGGSGSAAGSNGASGLGGNGATGVTATINSVVYGSGGAGGNFLSSNLATGGSGAGNGGTTSVNPTAPVANRGGGGGGSGLGNQKSTAGAAGLIIIKFAAKALGTLSYTGTPTYRTTTVITASTTMAAKVTFYANNKKIPGCVSKNTSANSASCNWKPSQRGTVAVSAQITPTDSNYQSTRTDSSRIFVVQRTNPR